MLPTKDRVVYVGCRANVNRSFIAEQMILHYMKDHPLPLEIHSGGVQVNEQACNMTYYPGVIKQFTIALQKMGLDYIIPNISRHQCRPFTIPEIKRADMILTMTKRQRDHLKTYARPTTQVLMISQLMDLDREEDIFDAMLDPACTVEAFVYEIAMLQYFLDFYSLKLRLGLGDK